VDRLTLSWNVHIAMIRIVIGYYMGRQKNACHLTNRYTGGIND